MIDLFIIFTRTGLVLFSHSPNPSPTLPTLSPTSLTLSTTVTTTLYSFIHSLLSLPTLIDSKLSNGQFNYNTFGEKDLTVGYKLENLLGVVVAVVYHKLFKPKYIGELLDTALNAFVKSHGKEVTTVYNGRISFDAEFMKILNKLEKSSRQTNIKRTQQLEINGNNKKQEDEKHLSKKQNKAGNNEDIINMGKFSGSEDGKLSSLSDREKEEKIDIKPGSDENLKLLEARAKLKEKFRRTGKTKKHVVAAEDNNSVKKKKEKRVWDTQKKITEEEAAELDLFAKLNKNTVMAEGNMVETSSPFLPDNIEQKVDFEEESDSESSDVAEDVENSSWKTGLKTFSSFFERISGQNALTQQDLEPALTSLKEHLLTKNVAKETSDQIILSLEQTLVGKKLNSFTKTNFQLVKQALTEALTKILSPNASKSNDLLFEVKSFLNASSRRAQSEKLPFVIVFLGVNGVGKSTTLSKVCYYLKTHNLSCQIIACDTFRSGSIEQLKKHSQNLKVDLYHDGYGKDPASVCFAGIKAATKKNIDVCLVDTAGRMQGNISLMKELQKLVKVNKNAINKIFFVGEMLVGNDGISQVQEFKKWLDVEKEIDGIILTKFDCVDEKVGAAVSLVHKSKVPIIFLGTGQKYNNLMRLDPRNVVKMLMN